MTLNLETQIICARCKVDFKLTSIKKVIVDTWALKIPEKRYMCRKCLTEVVNKKEDITIYHLDGSPFLREDIGK